MALALARFMATRVRSLRTWLLLLSCHVRRATYARASSWQASVSSLAPLTSKHGTQAYSTCACVRSLEYAG